MKLDVVWWQSVGVVFTAAILVAGGGKSKPAPAPDISTAPADTSTGDTEPPPVREGEDVQYVDPTSQYASILRPIQFEFNKYRITEEAKPTLEGIAKLLNQNATWKVLIEGHCDERGTNEYNL